MPELLVCFLIYFWGLLLRVLPSFRKASPGLRVWLRDLALRTFDFIPPETLDLALLDLASLVPNDLAEVLLSDFHRRF